MNNPPPQPNSHPHVADAVIADIATRKEMGLKKYGTPLQPFNGRRPLQDLYEELLDACHYLKQAMMETEALEEFGKSVDLVATPYLEKEVAKQMEGWKKLAAGRSEGRCSKTIAATSTPSTSDAGSTPKATESVNLGPSISAGGISDRDTASSNSLSVKLPRRTKAEQISYITDKVMTLIADRHLLRAERDTALAKLEEVRGELAAMKVKCEFESGAYEGAVIESDFWKKDRQRIFEMLKAAESDRDTARASLAEARRAIEPFLRYQTPSWLADQPGIKVRVEVTLTELKAAHDWLAKNQPYHNPTEPGDAT